MVHFFIIIKWTCSLCLYNFSHSFINLSKVLLHRCSFLILSFLSSPSLLLQLIKLLIWILQAINLGPIWLVIQTIFNLIFIAAKTLPYFIRIDASSRRNVHFILDSYISKVFRRIIRRFDLIIYINFDWFIFFLIKWSRFIFWLIGCFQNNTRLCWHNSFFLIFEDFMTNWFTCSRYLALSLLNRWARIRATLLICSSSLLYFDQFGWFHIIHWIFFFFRIKI